MENKTVTGGKVKLHKPHRKIVALTLIILLLILIVALIATRFINNDENNNSDTSICTDEIILSAKPNIEESNFEQLNPIAEDIKSKENHNQDINCVYILINNAVLSSNTNEAEYLLNLYSEKFNNGEVLSPTFNSDKGPIQLNDLEQLVQFKKESLEPKDGNYYILTGPQVEGESE